MFSKIISLLLLTKTFCFNIPTINIPAKVFDLSIKNYNTLQRLTDIEINDKTLGKSTVEYITNSLPKFDAISHMVLETNKNIVSYVINKEDIPDYIKKQIVLISIKLAQEGDNMGSHILQIYYDIVKDIL